MQGVISMVSSVFFYMQPSSQPAPFVEEAFFFIMCNSGFFTKTQVSTGAWIHFWVFSLIPLMNVSVWGQNYTAFIVNIMAL